MLLKKKNEKPKYKTHQVLIHFTSLG